MQFSYRYRHNGKCRADSGFVVHMSNGNVVALNNDFVVNRVNENVVALNNGCVAVAQMLTACKVAETDTKI